MPATDAYKKNKDLVKSFSVKMGGTYRKVSVTIGEIILVKIINRPKYLDPLGYKFFSLNLGLDNRRKKTKRL